MALSSSTITPTLKLSPPPTSQSARLLLRIPSNPNSAAPTSINKLLTAAPSDKWRLRISFFPAFLKKGKDVGALKEELLEAIAPLDRGAEATPEDQEMVDQVWYRYLSFEVLLCCSLKWKIFNLKEDLYGKATTMW